MTQFGATLTLDDEAIRLFFLVPADEVVEKGFKNSESAQADLKVHTAAVARLVDRVRQISEWYRTYEDFHVQYKHGLKLAMRPFGTPTTEAIDERRGNLSRALMAFTAEPIEQMVQGPKQQQLMAFPNVLPEAAPYLNALVRDRSILRYKMSGPPVDLNDVVEVSGTVAQLLRIAASNRIAIADGLDEQGTYKFQLPGEKQYEVVNVAIEPGIAPTLDDFF